MLDDITGALACPLCQARLTREEGVLACASGHRFDIARQGYVSLLPPGRRPPSGDTATMIAARAEFLAAGHYAGLASALADEAASADLPPGWIADVGAGTGYYLAAVLDRVPGRAGIALDASRFALRRAARAHPRIGAVGADAWNRLPVANGAVALALNVFAPRRGPELRRILHPGGRLLVVTPDAGHLAELTGPLGLLRVDPDKEERLAATLGADFELASARPCREVLTLPRRHAAVLAGMGPSAWHSDPGALEERAAHLPDPVPVTLAATISVFRPRPAGHTGASREETGWT